MIGVSFSSTETKADSLKIALFGGAFDPPHLGHQAIARYLTQEQIVDQVWWVPTGQHPFQKNMSDSRHRVAMVQLLIEENQRLEEWEVKQSRPSYTLATLKHFQASNPDFQFSWVIGSDNLAEFGLWHGASDILAQHQVLVYPREGYPKPPKLPEGFVFLDHAPLVTLSSTQVREHVQAGLPISGLVDSRVADYINQEQLYVQH